MENKNIFAAWDNAVDMDGLQKDIKEAANNSGSGDFPEIPHGKYEVAIEKLELKATKKGDPMVSVWMKIVGDGEFKGSMIFMNQVITKGFQIHIVNEFLRSLVKECEYIPTIEFRSYQQYADLLMDIHEMVADSFEYALNYSQNKKGYDRYEILEVYALED